MDTYGIGLSLQGVVRLCLESNKAVSRITAVKKTLEIIRTQRGKYV
jgi:hypothetical protein